MGDEDKSPEILFLIEEYKNIAATHDKVRDLLVRLFNYFLLLSAFPFTVAGIMFRTGGFDLLSAPPQIHSLFLFAGFGDLFLTLALVDARLGQYRYARTVNLIRKYFQDKVPDLSNYLYLPTRADIPSWTSLGFVGYQVGFMVIVGVLFVGFGARGFASLKWALIASGAYLVLYVVFHVRILRRYEQHKGIK